MILIADSGSTKCTWLLVGGTNIETVRTRGINAVQHTPEQVRAALAELPSCPAPEAVWFYGAGCGEQFPETTARLAEALRERFGETRIEIRSDLSGAARALFGHESGIACILGTGSNSCVYKDGEIAENTPPLGYILGDEGSGAALGKALLNGIYKGHIPLEDAFHTEYGLSYGEVIRRVYREPFANRFLASLAPFVRAHLDCAQVREMAAECFRGFVRRNLASYPKDLPVAFVGGVAYHFRELVREVVEAEGYALKQIVESPDEGLLKYHDGK